MSDEARRIDLTAQIIDLEPQMLRVLGPAQARDWVDVDLTMSQLKMMFVLSSAMGPVEGTSGLRVSEVRLWETSTSRATYRAESWTE